MAFVKLENGQPAKYPYTVGDFRKDNPQTSFPRNIPVTILRRHGVQPVMELPKPNTNLYQMAARDLMPHREVIRLKTEEDATDPITGEVDQDQVGQPIHGNNWFIGYTVRDMFSDYTDEDGVLHTKSEQEAAYQARLDADAAKSVRTKRDSLLAETDWVVVMHTEKGTNIPLDWEVYRQALRDITNHVNFPYLAEDDWPVKP